MSAQQTVVVVCVSLGEIWCNGDTPGAAGAEVVSSSSCKDFVP